MALACAGLLAACGQKASSVSDEHIRLSKLEPLESHTNSLIGKPRRVKPDEPDYVPEPVAQSLKGQLVKWKGGDAFVQALGYCSGVLVAERLGEKSACYNDFAIEPDAECVAKHGYGKQSIGQALTADRHDLNGDGIKDYIISDRYYCHDLSANQASVYFVMLSKSKKEYELAYADWASYSLSVVDDKVSGKLVLLEQAVKSGYQYTRIHHLKNSKYVLQACVYHDESGYQTCDEANGGSK